MSKKLLAVGVVLTLVAAVLVGVGVQTASAQTMSLCQTVDALIAAGVIAPDKVAAAKAAAGCSAVPAGAYTFTRSLTLGSTGADVTALQTFLISNGNVIPAGATGYFGAQTQAAVKAYQAAKGITPAVGYFGPITMASVNASTVIVTPASTVPGCAAGALFSATTGASCATGATPASTVVSGTDGTIDEIATLSQYKDEEVGASDQNVKVAGFEVTASNDGDVSISSVKLIFDPTNNAAGDSNHLDDYIDSVSIWMGSTEVGSANVSAFSENSDDTSTKTISLNGAIVKADASTKFYVTVDAVDNLDSGDIDDDAWTVGISSLRYVDGSGVNTTLDGGDAEIDNGVDEIGWNALGDGITIDFVDFGTAADTNLKISLDTTSPDAGIVIADDSDTTDGVVLLKGKIKVEGTSDVTIDELPVTLTVTGATQIDYVTGSVTLTIDGEDYSETVASTSLATATTTFNNLDLTLSAGQTYAFTISADINEISGNNFNEGDTLLASLTTTNRANIDAENEEGDALAATERTGSAIGEAQEFRTQGISLTLVSASETVSNSDTALADTATFVIKFKVTAVGDDAYVGTVAASAVTYVVDRSGTATTSTVSAALVNNTDTTLTAGGLYLIEDGTSETITLTVLKSGILANTAGLYRTSLTGVRWTDADTSENPLPNTYTSNLDDFVTDYVSLD